MKKAVVSLVFIAVLCTVSLGMALPTPNPFRSPLKTEAQIPYMWLPVIMSGPQPATPGKGVAGYVRADPLARMGASWCYNWDTNSSPRQVPMAKEGTYLPTKVEIERNPTGYWLLWNEPNQQGLSPETMAGYYCAQARRIRRYDPDVKLIAGGVNVSFYDWNDWPQRFNAARLSLCPGVAMPEGWHFHNYQMAVPPMNCAFWAQRMLAHIADIQSICPNCELWLTEFGSLSNPNDEWKYIIANCLPQVVDILDRWAPYGAKANGSWCPGCCCDMINPDNPNELTEYGEWYRGWTE